MRTPRRYLALTLITLLAVGGGLVWADEQQARKLLAQARQLEAQGRGNQAYRLYYQILRRHPKSGAVVEARYGAARYMVARRNWWQVGSLLQRGLTDKQHPLDAEWTYRYKRLIGQAWVEGFQANRKKVTYLEESLAHLVSKKAPRKEQDELRFLIARAHAGPHAYTTRNHRKEDAQRLDRAIATYKKLIADHGGQGETAARARFELGALWALHLTNLKGNRGFFPRVQRLELSKEGADYDARFRGGVASGLAIFEQLEARHVGSPWAAKAAYARGWVHDHLLNELPKAVTLYRKYVTDHPGSSHVGNARRRIERITREELNLSRTRILRPGKRPKLQVTARNIVTLDVRIWRVELDKVLERMKRSDLVWASREQVRQGGEPTERMAWKTGCREDHLGVRTSLKLPVSKPGAYLVLASGQSYEAATLVVLSDLALTTAVFNDQTLAMVSDLSTGQAVGDANVTFLHRRRVGSSRTGEDGMARFAPHSPRYGGSQLAVARRGDHYALSSGYQSYYHNRPGTHRVYVTTDRPLYRPGHKVNFKVVARRYVKRSYQNVVGARLDVRVFTPRGNPVYKKIVMADAQGTFSDAFELPKKTMLGMYRFHVTLDGRDSHWYNQNQGGTFRVEEYKKPEFLIDVAPGPGDYIPGDEIEMVSTTRYYDGQPVRTATVRYQVYWQRYVRPQPEPFRLNAPVQQGWRGRRWGGRWGWNPRRMISQGQGITDENGRFRVRFKSHPAEKDQRGWTGKPTGDGTFTVQLQVVDKSRRQVSGQGRINVVKQGMLATMSTSRNLCKPGQAVPVTVRLATAGGQPRGAKGWVSVKRAKGKVFELVKSFKLAVGADGLGRFEVTPDGEGFYRIEFNTSDRRDNPVDAAAFLMAASDAYQGAGGDKLTGRYRLLPDRPSYDIGQTARLLLAHPGYSGTAFVFLSADQELISQRTVAVKDGGGLFSLKLGDQHAPNVYVTAVVMGPKGLGLYRQQLKVTPGHRRLSIGVTPDQPHYRPGEKASVSVRVTGPDGKPRRTAFWVTVFDTSVLAIQPETARQILDHFYGHQRIYRARIYNSYGWSSGTRTSWLPGRTPTRIRTVRDPQALGWRYSNWFYGWNRGNYWEVPADQRRPTGKPGGPTTQSLRGGGAGRARSFGEAGPPAEDRMKDEEEARAPEMKAKSPARMARRQGQGDNGLARKEQQQQAAPKYKKATVRRNFQDTAFWAARVETDDQGQGTVSFALPDNLTTWKISARAITADTLVGQTDRTVRTRKLLRIRLAAPRFFTERDEVVLSGVVGNNLRTKKRVKLICRLTGGTLVLARGGETTHEREITLEPGKDYRADWRVRVVGSGRATVQLQALTDVESDAVERSFPVIRHGIRKHEGTSGAVVGVGGRMAGDKLVTLPVQVPEARDVESTELRVVLAPSAAVTALEALPYLARYPYGCVEQTMSRFGPSVLVKHSLAKLGLPIEALVGDKKGKKIPSGLWGKPHYVKMATLRGADLDRMVEAGLARLYAFQHADGGWGWWKHDRTNPYMTAYVVDGLLTARDSDVAVRDAAIRRGLDYLAGRLERVDLSRLETKAKRRYSTWERNRLSYQTYVVLRGMSKKATAQRKELVALAQHMADNADGLSAYARALVALACHASGSKQQATALVAELSKQAIVHPKSGDVSWSRSTDWWRWYRDPVETAAFGLRALLVIDPDSKLIPGVVQFLVHARRGTRWHSTKTTSIAISALIDYLKVSGEMNPDFTATVKYGDTVLGSVRFTRENLLSAENVFRIRGKQIPSGAGAITITKKGQGNLYYAAFVSYFTLEEDITPGGHRIAVSRKFVRIRKVRETVGKSIVTRETREPLKSGSRVVSGDIVEVTLTLDSDRDYEYLALEDRKAAGLEPLRQTSGRGPGIATHMEMRDDRVVLFASRVPKGKSKIVYRFRAEAPGDFHALPMTGYLMYAPDIRASSAEWRVKITDE